MGKFMNFIEGRGFWLLCLAVVFGVPMLWGALVELGVIR